MITKPTKIIDVIQYVVNGIPTTALLNFCNSSNRAMLESLEGIFV